MNPTQKQNAILPEMKNFKIFMIYCLIFLAFFIKDLAGGRLIASGDAVLFYLPNFFGEYRNWSPDIYSGYPLLADPQFMQWYPLNWLLPRNVLGWNLLVISPLILGAFFTFLLVKRLTLSNFAGFISGLIFGMSQFFFSHLNHTTYMHATAWLPLMLFAADKLCSEKKQLWIAVLAVATAAGLLAGAPQIWCYSIALVGLYALVVGTTKSKHPIRYILACFIGIFLGTGLCAIQILPTLEFVQHSWRHEITFKFFTMNALPISDLWAMFSPSWGKGGESGGIFTGLVALFLCFLGLGFHKMLHHKKRELLFWTGIAILSVCLALSSKGLLAYLIFKIPIYNKFRVPARHLLEFSMAVSILAGYGTSVLHSLDPAKVRHLRRLVGIFFSFIFILLIAHWAQSGALGQADLWPFFFLFVVSGLFVFSNRIPLPIRKALLALILVFELGKGVHHSLQNRSHPTPAQLNTPANLTALTHDADVSGCRVVSLYGYQSSKAQATPNLCTLWGLSNASGYSPLVLKRYHELTKIHYWGEFEASSMNKTDISLDLLGAKYATVPTHWLDRNDLNFEHDIVWSNKNLNLDLGLPEKRLLSSMHYMIDDFSTSRLVFVNGLADSKDIPNNTPVMSIQIKGTNGESLTKTIRAGVDTADWQWDEHRTSGVQNTKADVFDDFDYTSEGKGHKATRYLSELSLASPMRIKELHLKWIGDPDSRIKIFHFTLIGPDHTWYTLIPFQNLVADHTRWEVFDQGKDTVIFKNNRALPRYWFCENIKVLSPSDILNSIHTSLLPDNHAFDAAHTALLEEQVDFSPTGLSHNAQVDAIHTGDGRIELTTRSDSDAFLVLSEIFYPGWKALIDGQETKIHQTDYILRGVHIPSGVHQVQFFFQPDSRKSGSMLSVICLLVCLPLFFSYRK